MFNSTILNSIFSCLQLNFPEAKTELQYFNDYTLLIAVVLSSQSSDKSVNSVTESLFKIIDSPEKMLVLGEERLKNYIKNLGLYNNKSKNIIALSKILIKSYNSQVPKNFNDLINLPGVGRKTANVILNTLYHEPVIAIDTHVFRVVNRIGIIKEKNIYKLEIKLLNIIEKKWLPKAHNLLVLHGRYTCKAIKPKCSECCVGSYCQYLMSKKD